MRIGIMLRAFNEKGGVGVYTQNIVRELLALDQDNHYTLFFRRPEDMGCFDKLDNAVEILIRAPSTALWDQVAIPNACRRHQIDVLFHPKFTAPLLAPCKTVMTVHGADWLVPRQAQYYNWLDVRYMRLFLPLYVRKCTAIISVSRLTTENFYALLDLPPGKMETVYFGPARHFRQVTDPDRQQAVRARYDLPERFILTLTKRQGGERKNLGQIFEAYARYHRNVENPYSLVVGGKDCHLFRDEYHLSEEAYGADVCFPGWIDQEDLPAVYSQAGLYLYPSNLEAFPIPLTEAMACGTPVVTSNVNGLAEIAGDAGLLVDPQDSDAIAGAIGRVLGDPELRARLSRRGLARSQQFSWQKCAEKTLAILTAVHEEQWPRHGWPR